LRVLQGFLESNFWNYPEVVILSEAKDLCNWPPITSVLRFAQDDKDL
jgi:hypothetical protein